MCGHVGIAGDLEYKDEAAMKRLFLLDVFRGPDSTGFAAVRENNEVHVAKVPSHPFDLFDMGRFKTALSGHNSRVFLGHNRRATRGAVTAGNAHPFAFDHIIGAHNGTLDYQSVKELEEEMGEMFLVDSQAIFAAIAKLGVEKTVSMMREGKNADTGAWALVWYDMKEKTLNFLRNKHRPMWYAYTEDFKKLFWASEWQMIDSAARLFGDYKLYREEESGVGYRFFAMDENVHYVYDVEALSKGSDKRPKPKAKQIKGKEPAPVVNSTSSYDPFNFTEGVGFTVTPTEAGKTQTTRSGTSGTKAKKDPVIVHLLGDLNNPFGGQVDYNRFLELAKYGCSWCQADVLWGEQGVTVYERDDMILCAECSGNEGGQSRIYTRAPVIAQ